MKRLFGLMLVLLSQGITGQAQTIPAAVKNNYAVSTVKIPQLEPILLTAAALKQEDGESYGDFQIVIYGPNLTGLTNIEEMERTATLAKATGAKLVVCRIALNKAGIDPADLHPEIKVVDHAFTHLLQLQKNKNYYSLQL